MNFSSDNATGACPEVMEAIVAANAGSVIAYGNDAWTAWAEDALSELFECPLAAFPVATGTAANALALAALVPPWGSVLCHRHAHVEEDECGAPELFSGGAKLRLLDGPDGKLSAETVTAALAAAPFGVEHHVQPAALSLSQATECGTVYSVAETAALCRAAKAKGLAVHMDGARLANAVAALGCTPADATWRAGVDVLSFGATKNGAWAAEAVIFFDRARAADFKYLRKRTGHLFSKMRLLSAQLTAYARNGVWLKNAQHANACARRLADGLVARAGGRLAHPTQANAVFVALAPAVCKTLIEHEVAFHRWPASGPDVIRLVTAFNTDTAEVDRLIEIAAAAGHAP